MKRFCSALFAGLLLIALSSPVWAQNDSHFGSKFWKIKHNYHYYQYIKKRIHQRIVKHQFRALKKRYNRSYPEAQQLFLEYLGTALPSAEEQLQQLREEYEQKIAVLNETIATLQQQLEDLTAQMNAACDARLAQAQEDWQTALQQQLNELNAAHQAELENLTEQLNAQCEERVAQAYLDCQASGPPQQVGAWSTNTLSPYAIDEDGSGNIFVLDRNHLSVAQFDAAGNQLEEWSPGSLHLPVDLAADAQGQVYVLDQQASLPLQKFGADGTPMAFNSSSVQLSFPMGLFIDSSNTIYVTDMGGAHGGRVLTFDTSGNLLGTFGEVPELTLEEYRDVVVDENNQMIYVVTGYMVAKFDINGGYLGSWFGEESRSPYGIATATNGDIYIADTFSNQIDQYDSDGNLKFSFADDLYRPYHIFTGHDGKLYVADHGNMQIKVYE